jgi:hypothetical protein
VKGHRGAAAVMIHRSAVPPHNGKVATVTFLILTNAVVFCFGLMLLG